MNLGAMPWEALRGKAWEERCTDKLEVKAEGCWHWARAGNKARTAADQLPEQMLDLPHPSPKGRVGLA